MNYAFAGNSYRNVLKTNHSQNRICKHVQCDGLWEKQDEKTVIDKVNQLVCEKYTCLSHVALYIDKLCLIHDINIVSSKGDLGSFISVCRRLKELILVGHIRESLRNYCESIKNVNLSCSSIDQDLSQIENSLVENKFLL